MPQYVEDVENKYWYDSHISAPSPTADPVTFEYTIGLRIYLERINPPGGKKSFSAPDHNGTMVPILRWDDASWMHFTTLYVQRILDVWDQAFILIPPASYNGFIWPEKGKRRNLLCRIAIKLVDSAATAHAPIKVVRLANPSANAFRSDAENYDSGDVDLSRQRFNPDGATFLHNVPAHEVGHLLGLWHSGEGDPRCDSLKSNGACYGTDLHTRMNVMGAGSMLDLEDATPWTSRIPKHVTSIKAPEWKVDWASSEAALRGLTGMEIDEDRKEPYKAPQPGIIDL